jgi:hypothetical protein
LSDKKKKMYTKDPYTVPVKESRGKIQYTIQDAIRIGRKLGVDFSVIRPETLLQGIQVEMEHGTQNPRTNVTDDKLEPTAKIALAHLEEDPKYYYALLQQAESISEDYWSSVPGGKPEIFER